jgi:hypothetical protein
MIPSHSTSIYHKQHTILHTNNNYCISGVTMGQSCIVRGHAGCNDSGIAGYKVDQMARFILDFDNFFDPSILHLPSSGSSRIHGRIHEWVELLF